MLASFLKRTIPGHVVTDDIVIIDSVLPNKDAIGPRNSDALELIERLPGFRYYTMYPMTPGKEAWFVHGYGMAKDVFKKNLKGYIQKYPQAAGRIRLLSATKSYKFNLAYTYFLAETYTMLPFLEKNRIPFVFLLNPGGAFGIDNASSDKMLKAIFASQYFTKVIVNQRLFEDYLLQNKLCAANDIVFDFSGSVQFNRADIKPKKLYPADKPTFDICFVASKYSPKGIDKGYDLFVAAAKKLAKHNPDMRFHVVGGFDENEIDVSTIKEVITFYGYLPPAALPDFYGSMDIYLSANRAFKLYEGGSDGFPLSAGAMYCGVAGFNSDELSMNTEFKNDEVVIVKTQVKDIVEKVQYFYEHPKELYALSRKGQKRAQKVYDIDEHIKQRIALFRNIIAGR